MLRIILATAAAAGMTAGVAGAQGLVPGAAAVEGYHERFAVDSAPERLPPPTNLVIDRQLPAAVPGIDRTVVMSPVAAAIPRPRPLIADGSRVPSSAGLTPGAPLGSDGYSDQKAVAGERR